MAKAELGEKRRCLTCSTAFFDLKRSPVVCPKCAAVFQVIEQARSSMKYAPRPVRFGRSGPAAPTPIVEETTLLVEDDEDAVAETESEVSEDAEDEVPEDEAAT
ncbi:MAG: TIGR02300 family protein [Methylocystis sp.]|nr:MAG: TIGR02300 family protein [Methylocystis sp.]